MLIFLRIIGILFMLGIGFHLLSTRVNAETRQPSSRHVLSCFNYTSCQKNSNKNFLAFNVINKTTPKVTPIKLTQTPTPTSIPKETSIPTSMPTVSIIPDTPTPTSIPAIATSSTTGNSSLADQLFSMVNDHRKSINLPVFEKDDKVCQVAASRDADLEGEAASGNYHAGLKSKNLPYWITENMAFYSTPEQDMQFWLSDYIHKKAIEGESKYSCVYCHGNICVEEFTSYVAK